MATYAWVGGGFLWTTPGAFFDPNTFINYDGPPGAGDIVSLSNAPTLDGIAIVDQTWNLNVIHGEIAVTLQDTSFDAFTTINVSGNGFWSNEDFGTLATAATINIGTPGTFGEASFLLAQTLTTTLTPSITNTGVINIDNGHVILNDGNTIDGQFFNFDVINVENAGPQVSDLFDDLTNGVDGFVNDGSIVINGNGATIETLALGFFAGAIIGTGNISITDGELSVQAVSAGQEIDFQDNHGILILGTNDVPGDTFQATIDGFRPGDTIDLGIAATSVDPSQVGIVRILNGVSQVGSLDLTAAFGSNIFALSQGTNGHGLLEMVAPCFAAGTRILTSTGEIPVEHLREGDLVITAQHRRPEPIRWIGHRHIIARMHRRPAEVYPVGIRAHAFGPNTPHADLLLSPDHAVFVDGALIPIRLLINGTSITQQRVDQVTYYHVELPRHDILLAQGLPCESYLDTGNRTNFANADATILLHPDFSSLRWDINACAPLIMTGPKLNAARTKTTQTNSPLPLREGQGEGNSYQEPEVTTYCDR